MARVALTRAAASSALCLVAGCALPSGPEPGLQPLPAREVAQRLTVVGAHGVVSEATEARDLARVKAEGSGGLLQRQLAVMAAQGPQTLYRGNTAQLLIDGPATLSAMKDAIGAARERVLLEFYIVEDIGVAAEVGELLLRKAADGVLVALMYDSLGSMGTSKAFFEHLRAGGVRVCAFNPVNPLEQRGHWGLVHRDHRKLLVVDGAVGFTGGINLSNVYAEGSFRSGGHPRAGQAPPDGWRDTQVELRGPVVTAMAALFHAAWAAQHCSDPLPAAAAAAPLPAAQAVKNAPDDRVVRLVAGDPHQGVNPSYTLLMGAIGAARRSVHLTMAYFAPGPDLVLALSDAARRGVEVSLVLPGRSDVSLVLHAARSYYTQLLDAGVTVHEMQHSVMHAKTSVIDGVLSSVGSSNLDWRSIVGNSEIDVIVLGEEFGQQLEEQFRRDLSISQRIDPGTWRQRGLGRRMLELFGRMVEPLL